MRHALLLVAVVGVAIALSVALIPRSGELALMQLKDRNYSAARDAYRRQLAAGKVEASVVAPFAELSVRAGDIDAAIEALERYRAAHPDSIPVLKRLSEYYAEAQRPKDFVRNLERLTGRAPSKKDLNELIQRYDSASRYPDEIRALRMLIGKGWARPDQRLALARLQAARGQLTAAAQTLDEWLMSRPREFDEEASSLLVSLLLDTRRAERALTVGRSALAGRPSDDLALELAALFADRHRRDLALAVIEPLATRPDRYPMVLALDARMRIEAGHAESVYGRLMALDRDGRLPARLTEALIEAALESGHDDVALDKARGLDAATAPYWLLARIGDAALRGGRVREVAPLLENPALLRAWPVLAARLAFARADRAEAENWLRRAETNPALEPEQRLALLTIERRMGRIVALRRLLAGMRLGDLSGAMLRELAPFFIEQDMAAVALVALTASGPLDAGRRPGWALLAAAGGKPDAVAEWLRRAPPGTLDLALLDNLQTVAQTHGHSELALQSARLAYRMAPGPAQRLALADALLANQEPLAALVELRTLRGEDAEIEARYRTALYAAYRADAAVGPELRAVVDDALARRALEPALSRQIVYDVLALGAYDAVLPALTELATASPEQWYDVYRETALKAGRERALIEFLKRDLARADLAPKARAERIYSLQQIAGDEAALPYLRRAADAGGGVAYYAYREAALKSGHQAELVAFLEADLKRADLAPKARTERIYSLQKIAGDEAALPYLRRAADVGGDTAYYAYQETALRAGRTPELVAFLERELQGTGLSPGARAERIYALQQIGGAIAALPYLRRAAEAGGESAYYAYREAAFKAGRTRELASFLRRHLGDTKLSAAARGERIETLRKIAGVEAVLPYVRRLAYADVGDWPVTYAELLRQAGHPKRLADFLVRELKRPSLSVTRRRALADELLALGRKAEAERAYLQLAASALPTDPIIAQLLFLWGPRAPRAAVDWLAQRTARDGARRQAAWARHLITVGAAPRVVELLEKPALRLGAPNVLLDVYLDALVAARDAPGLARAAERLFATPQSVARLRRLAAAGEALQRFEVARRARVAILRWRPEDAPTLRALAFATYERGDLNAALIFLQRYHRVAPGDYESQFLHAEVLNATAGREPAVARFRRALAMVEATPSPSFRMREVRARCLRQLGFMAAADAAYRGLLAARPQAADVRADYAEMLLDAGEIGGAENALAAR